jgi:hypothetical protein
MITAGICHIEISVALLAVLEHENQFVLAAVKRAHARVVFDPYANILKLCVNLLACHH